MLLETIGSTNLITLANLVKRGRVFVKIEKQNPSGSIKDRAAYFMIKDAELKGLLGGNQKTIVEPTSGNTGIALAMIGANKGYRVILTMPANMTPERIKILKMLGAEVILTPAEKGMIGAIEEAKRIRDESRAFMPDQFTNSQNVLAHELTTGPEILKQTSYDIDIFVAGIGTGGTITGIGRALRKVFGKKIKIIGVEPLSSPILSEGRRGKHKIQGIGAGFVPPILEESLIDDIVKVKDDDAIDMARTLLKKEGLSSGISTGANIWAAISLLKRYGYNKKVVTVAPDGRDKYMSML